TGQVKLKEAERSLGPNVHTVVVKKGSEGSVVFDGQQVTELAAFKNEKVVDAIGAGDSFNAGFVFKYVQGAPLNECQRFANLCGAVNTTAAGGTTAFKDYATVMKIAREKLGVEDF
ncbi:carbohydrate kinase family protein, partial [candidate division KSB1 bacterium]